LHLIHKKKNYELYHITVYHPQLSIPVFEQMSVCNSGCIFFLQAPMDLLSVSARIFRLLIDVFPRARARRCVAKMATHFLPPRGRPHDCRRGALKQDGGDTLMPPRGASVFAAQRNHYAHLEDEAKFCCWGPELQPRLVSSYASNLKK
jgi:hypothetical protein